MKITIRGENWTEETEGRHLKRFAPLVLVLHQDKQTHWRVSEASTGTLVTGPHTAAEVAIAMTEALINRKGLPAFQRAIEERQLKLGLKKA